VNETVAEMDVAAVEVEVSALGLRATALVFEPVAVLVTRLCFGGGCATIATAFDWKRVPSQSVLVVDDAHGRQPCLSEVPWDRRSGCKRHSLGGSLAMHPNH
jgi:hypothetical protein